MEYKNNKKYARSKYKILNDVNWSTKKEASNENKNHDSSFGYVFITEQRIVFV